MGEDETDDTVVPSAKASSLKTALLVDSVAFMEGLRVVGVMEDAALTLVLVEVVDVVVVIVEVDDVVGVSVVVDNTNIRNSGVVKSV